MSVRRAGPLVLGVLLTLLASVLAPGPAAARSERLRLDFDNDEPLTVGSRVVDVSGSGHHGTVRTLNDGALRPSGGYAGSTGADYPVPCTTAPCPKAIVEVPDNPQLDPGTRALRWGVRVRLRSTETSDGSNLLQKGLWGDPGGQWKLQIDGYGGRPSCVVSGYRDGTYRRVTVWSSVSVADDRWHQVTCRRGYSEVYVMVDGVIRGRAAMRPVLLSNGAPVRVGGKRADQQDNDQFHGLLDDAFVAFG